MNLFLYFNIFEQLIKNIYFKFYSCSNSVMCCRRAPAGYSENDARFYYEREQLPEVQVHIQRTQKKNYIGSQKRLPKQTRNILVMKERNLFKTAGLIRMKRTTTTSIIHGHYHCHVLLCQCRTCVHPHSPFLTTPHIADHEDWWMCQFTHGNDKNEYSSHEKRVFINKKRNKIVRKFEKKLDKHIQNNIYTCDIAPTFWTSSIFLQDQYLWPKVSYSRDMLGKQRIWQ